MFWGLGFGDFRVFARAWGFGVCGERFGVWLKATGQRDPSTMLVRLDLSWARAKQRLIGP